MKLGKRWQPPQEPSCAKLALLVDNDNNGHDRAERTTHQRAQKGGREKRRGQSSSERGFGKKYMHGKVPVKGFKFLTGLHYWAANTITHGPVSMGRARDQLHA
eukprot:14387339-Ditylum_brightwellii.AAC.1